MSFSLKYTTYQLELEIMSQETVKEFFDFAKTSENIQNQFKSGVSYEGIVSIASEKGYTFTEQELQMHLKEDKTIKAVNNGDELSETELEAVAGGCGGGCVIIIILPE